jgi:hypothetical protein
MRGGLSASVASGVFRSIRVLPALTYSGQMPIDLTAGSQKHRPRLGDLVNHHLVCNAAQGCSSGYRLQIMALQQH